MRAARSSEPFSLSQKHALLVGRVWLKNVPPVLYDSSYMQSSSRKAYRLYSHRTSSTRTRCINDQTAQNLSFVKHLLARLLIVKLICIMSVPHARINAATSVAIAIERAHLDDNPRETMRLIREMRTMGFCKVSLSQTMMRYNFTFSGDGPSVRRRQAANVDPQKQRLSRSTNSGML